MKFHKLMSRTVIATALLGATIGGAFSGINASAGTGRDTINNGSTSNGSEVIPTPSNPVSNDTNKNNETTFNTSNLAVNNNSLTLDSVPNLNFGGDNKSNTLSLNTPTDDKSGLLEVTDYRNEDNSTGTNNTWNLSANMGKVEENGANNNQHINQDWKMNLYNESSKVNNPSNDSTANINSVTSLYNNNGDSGSDNSSTIMSKDSSHSGYGVNQINYNNPDSQSSAQLIIPNVAPGNYKTNVTWTLNTNVPEDSNSGQ